MHIWVKEDLIWGSWMQLCTFEGIYGIWVEDDLIWGCWLQCANLRALHVNWVYWWCKDTFEFIKAWFECIGSAKACLNYGGPDLSCRGIVLSGLRVQWHIELKRLDLSGFRMQMHIWVLEGLIWVVWGWNAHYNFEGHDLSGFRVQRQIWEKEGSFEFKWILFE